MAWAPDLQEQFTMAARYVDQFSKERIRETCRYAILPVTF